MLLLINSTSVLVAYTSEAKNKMQSENNFTLTPPYQWIHPQKTGSSFGNELFSLTCPEQTAQIALANRQGSLDKYSIVKGRGIVGIEKSCRKKWHMTKFDRVVGRATRPRWVIGEHYSWSAKVPPSSTFVTLRSPTNRIRSLTEWRFGSCTHDALKMMEKRRKKGPWNSYVDYLAGSAKLRLEEKKSLALERLSLAAWIGLTDYFNASICVLQNLFPHDPHPTPYSNMRKTISKTTSNKEEKEGGEKSEYFCSPHNLQSMFESSYKDDIDVYVYAVRVFSEKLLQYAPGCAKLITSISSYEPIQAMKILEKLRREQGRW